MADIRNWMEKFQNRWEAKEVRKVLELFTDDVEYYETPSEKLSGKELRQEWENIREQDKISLEYEVFSSDNNKHTVKWNLSYLSDGNRKNLDGIYLIKLNENGKCYEFWQYCQSE